MSKEKLQATQAGKAPNTFRQPTPEELKTHDAEKAGILRSIQQNHAKTMRQVKKMQTVPLYVDRGA